MSKELEKKIRDVEDAHFSDVEKTRMEHFDMQFIHRAYKVRGALHAVGSIADMLMSQHIRGLMVIEEEKLWRAYEEGYSSFADYLSKSAEVGMSKTSYYDRRDVLLTAGDEVLDAVNGKVSPRKIQKLLTDGVQMSVEDGHLKIGEESIAINDSRGIANLIEGWHRTLVERDERDAAKDAKIEKLTEQIATGSEEYNQLQRNFDALRAANPHDRAVSNALQSLLHLTESAGSLPDDVKAAKGKDTVQTLWSVMLRVRDAYGISTPLSEIESVPANDLDRKIADALNEDDDLDLEA